MQQIKGTSGQMDYEYTPEGTKTTIPDGCTLTLELCGADGSAVWAEPKTLALDVPTTTYPYTLTAADNDTSETRVAVWTLYDTDGTTVLMTDREEFDVLFSANVYCTEAAVRALVGNPDIASTLSVATYIQNAADAVNTALKAKYVTPVVTENREDQKLLKIITECLAASYMIEAMSVGTEAAEMMLRSAARMANRAMTGVLSDGLVVQPGLKSITEGLFVLEGAELRETVTSTARMYAGAKNKKVRDYAGNAKDGSWFDQVYGDDLDE